MSDDTDTTRWSLPGPADMPRDELQMQLEVYKETVLLRGFESDSTWVRTVSADAIANVFTQHLGFSSGILPEETLWWNQGETAMWWPSGGRRRSGRWPCNGRRSSHPHGSAPHAGANLRLLAGPGALGLRRAEPAKPTPSSISSGPRPSTSSETGGSAPEATGSPRRWD